MRFISQTTASLLRRTPARRGALLLAALLFTSGMLHAQAPAQAIQGRVMNGTTGQPVPKAQVQYVMMAQGLTPAATQVTDSQGRFRFDNPPASGGGPVLLRVEYQGATYSRPVMPQQSGSGDMEIQVFEAGRQPGMVSVKEHAIFFRPSGGVLLVLEQAVLENSSQPPRTYVNPKGTFPFTLPGATREGVKATVEGPGGMPINQSPVPGDTANDFAINYPIRPGETQVRLEYALDYKSPFEFSKPLGLPPRELYVVTPGKEVQVTGEGLTAKGADPSTGFTAYQVAQKDNRLRVQIQGEAPPTAAGDQNEGSDEESAALAPIPAPASNQRWLILSGAGLALLAGLIYHYRRELR
jgi:hypothetical protein